MFPPFIIRYILSSQDPKDLLSFKPQWVATPFVNVLLGFDCSEVGLFLNSNFLREWTLQQNWQQPPHFHWPHVSKALYFIQQNHNLFGDSEFNKKHRSWGNGPEPDTVGCWGFFWWEIFCLPAFPCPGLRWAGLSHEYSAWSLVSVQLGQIRRVWYPQLGLQRHWQMWWSTCAPVRLPWLCQQGDLLVTQDVPQRCLI